MSEDFFRRLASRAAQRYRPAGRAAAGFARGKLAGDPMFRALLSRSLIPDGARVLDIGCGAALVAAWLAAADEAFEAGDWPQPDHPPRPASYRGLELMPRDVDRAQWALAGLADACVERADMRCTELPQSDVILLLDTLHYVDRSDQEALLARSREALPPHGRLILRVGDASAGLRFRYGQAVDRLVCLARGLGPGRLHARPLAEWRRLLEDQGFDHQTRAMSGGTPFANSLLLAWRREAGMPLLESIPDPVGHRS